MSINRDMKKYVLEHKETARTHLVLRVKNGGA